MAFNQIKTAQVASWLLARCGSPMDILKLMKLLYLADREAMSRYGSSITGDRMVAMPHGPVLSQTLDLMNGAGPVVEGGWDSRVSDRAGRRISLQEGSSVDRESLDEISDAELETLEKVASEFGALSAWELREYTHRHCSEWVDPCGSSVPIAYEDVFRALGRNEDESKALALELRSDDSVDRIFSRL